MTTRRPARHIAMIGDGPCYACIAGLPGEYHPHTPHDGRPRKLTPEQLALTQRMRASGEPVPVIAETLGMSTPSIYRLLAERSKLTA